VPWSSRAERRGGRVGRRVGITLVAALVAGAAVVVVLLITGASSDSRFRAPGGIADVRTRIARAVPPSLRAAHVPGAAVAIAHDGRIAWVDPGAPLPSTADSLAGRGPAGSATAVRLVDRPGPATTSMGARCPATATPNWPPRDWRRALATWGASPRRCCAGSDRRRPRGAASGD
jgi:hypothetical protein